MNLLVEENRSIARTSAGRERSLKERNVTQATRDARSPETRVEKIKAPWDVKSLPRPRNFLPFVTIREIYVSHLLQLVVYLGQVILCII